MEPKFIHEIELEPGWEIETDTGFEPVSRIYKTVKYEKYILTTETETLGCADLHKVFDSEYNEVFVKDLKPGDSIITKNGIQEVLSVENTFVPEHMYDISVDSANHRYYANNILSHNTTVTVCFLLWYVLFHKDKNCAVLANKGATARTIISRIELAYMNLPFWLQAGTTEWNKGSFALENGSSVISAATSSDSVRGNSYSLIFLDEVAFCNGFLEFWRSTFPTISSGTDTKAILVSTFNGQNHFYDMWEDAIAGRSLFKPTRVDWWDVPGRDEKWHQDQLRNMSEEDFAQEYGNEALGSGSTLITSRGFSVLESTRTDPIQSTVTTKIYELPERNHRYILSCDCADTGIDYSSINIIDVTEFPYKQVLTYKDNKVSHLMFPHIILQYALKYNNAAVLIESNDIGKLILHILVHEMEYENIIRTRSGAKTHYGQRTTTKTKAIGCANLKELIETRKLLIRDTGTIMEFKHFVINSKASYSAEPGYHDDLVMGLVIFACYASTNSFKLEYDRNFIDEANEYYEQELQESLVPLPIFGNQQENPMDDLPKGFLD